MTDELDQSRKQYLKDADLRSTKPRFGYFSIPPSHTAGKTDFYKAKCRKNPDGRISTNQRNIYAGPCRSGTLQKSYFSVAKSIHQGDPYCDPHQYSRYNNSVEQSYLLQGREIFKPAMLNKTLSTPAYQYVCEDPCKKDPKRNRNSDGGVRVKQRNFVTNSIKKLAAEKDREFRYVNNSYDEARRMRNEEEARSRNNRRGDGPFKIGSPGKDYFYTNIQTYNDESYKPKLKKILRNSHNFVEHENGFRPSCRSTDKLFSRPLHDTSLQIEDGKGKSSWYETKRKRPSNTQVFRLSSNKEQSKPSPSIAYSKINLFKKIR